MEKIFIILFETVFLWYTNLHSHFKQYLEFCKQVALYVFYQRIHCVSIIMLRFHKSYFGIEHHNSIIINLTEICHVKFRDRRQTGCHGNQRFAEYSAVRFVTCEV